jgi:hypothetical protein
MRYSEEVKFVIFRNVITDESFAFSRSDAVVIDMHYNDWNHFLYAPEDLSAEGYQVSHDRRGIMNLAYDNKISLKVRDLVPTWVYISE